LKTKSTEFRIERRYLEEEEWQEVSEEEFLRRTEWGGFFKKGTALDALKTKKTLRTETSEFRVKK
jgi:hypothetical protein